MVRLMYEFVQVFRACREKSMSNLAPIQDELCRGMGILPISWSSSATLELDMVYLMPESENNNGIW